jgi:hypothetical protein
LGECGVILLYNLIIAAMKRIRTILSVLLISFLPLSLTFGQEKKNEQKVKVVIADKSGTKVVIDTTFNGTGEIDSVILKNGKVIYIHDINEKGKPEKQYKVITHVDKDGENTEHQYIYINDGKVVRHSGSDKFDVIVSDNEFDNDLDKTRYVIAKDGITVSIEGNDELKIKELVKEIEKRLDINNESDQPATKEVEKKIVKKN